MITAGHCTTVASTWYADSSQTTVLGTRTATSFPGNDYGVIRYTGRIAHPSAVYTYPGLLTIYGAGSAYVGQAVCRSGATTGVRCGTVTGLNQTVNYAGGNVVYGLIRYQHLRGAGGQRRAALRGGHRHHHRHPLRRQRQLHVRRHHLLQPIGEVLAAYGLTLP
ncbi:S1 family peptidase [Micromonospora cremea]|uniref:S1 family peptidase n=1 Tax=Micromonospora cremea TaxID=709881 RepID=UPI000AF9E823